MQGYLDMCWMYSFGRTNLRPLSGYLSIGSCSLVQPGRLQLHLALSNTSNISRSSHRAVISIVLDTPLRARCLVASRQSCNDFNSYMRRLAAHVTNTTTTTTATATDELQTLLCRCC